MRVWGKGELHVGQLRIGAKGIPFIVITVRESGDPEGDLVDILISGEVKRSLRAQTVRDNSSLVSASD
jgi:hypothetical protein